MKISEVSKITGLSNDTLRYYEKIGLISNIERNGSIRNYSQSNLNQLDFIICMLKTGMKLEDLKKFIELSEQGDATIKQRIAILKHNRVELQQKIVDLEDTLDFLNKKIELYQKK